MPNQPPYFDSRREYESLVHLYRVDMGLSYRELSLLANVPTADIAALANGMKSPLLEKGGLCLSALKLCNFFGIEAEDLFPRYSCSLDNAFQFENVPYETYSERISNSTLSQMEDKEYLLKLFVLLLDKYPSEIRGVEVLIHWCLGETYDEIAKREGVSRERIRNIYIRILRRLREVSYTMEKEKDSE